MRLESHRQFRKSFREKGFRKLSLAAILSTNLIAGPAWSQPHSVSGVNADSVLNIRADIDQTLNVGSSDIIGTIPHDASDVMVTGISVDIGHTKWREIKYNGTVGWVNARYLTPTSSSLERPEALQCAGTEPFWNVAIDENDSTFISPDQESPLELDYLRLAPGIGRADLWGHYLGSADGAYFLTVIVRYTEACSDGMSDLTYDYEALLLGLSASGAPAYGCCGIRH
ncbi:hypothetical protein [Roseibium marinum]|uniref:SH3 domain-containing protein n=1 Tax=Roseibium marinum TaxID=281252 RepID=A0A2S3UL50_9HYPH|nr:hypothetical protein [Roseibium marinum]POF28452.1 hypothetical protein CLV41_11315 [Roseibium marinum]